MQKVLIRFDDICPTMDWNMWAKAEAILDKYDAKPLIGVIPCNKDNDLFLDDSREDFYDYIKGLQSKGYQIAMHGVNHMFFSNHRGILTKRVGSEFAGLSYKEQYDKLREGKEILEKHGIVTDVFFAPGHSYDENTVRALSSLGFKYISDGKSNRPYKWHGITFLPCRNSGASFRKSEFATSIYHAHEWRVKDCSRELEDILCKYKILNFDEYKLQSISCRIYQRIIEVCYVFIQFNIAPFIRKIKR